MLKIAITGNIASGKSQVEKILSDAGYIVYDTDIMAHKILDKIDYFFGYDVFSNGKIDRKKLGSLVFSNPELKNKLEEMIHPKIKKEILDLFEKFKNNEYVFISVPLLYEAGFDDIFDKTILITVDKDIQLKRLMERNNFSKEEAIKRINSQMSQDIKAFKADYIIQNNKSIGDLEKQVMDVLRRL